MDTLSHIDAYVIRPAVYAHECNFSLHRPTRFAWSYEDGEIWMTALEKLLH